ncbi:MAG: DUF885 domain-containing protein [Eubacteriales bacterium]|nr:DUF885 domain-containing protein [Eubacteriales bacterium]
MKKISLALIPASCFLLLGICRYYNASDSRSAAREFDTFTESMFQSEITSSTLNLHYTLAEPENYGISDYPITYGSTDKISLVSSETGNSPEFYLKELSAISYRNLSTNDQLTYDILLLALDNASKASDFALYQEPLGPTIGVQAQLPVLLSEYTFYDEKDIRDYLELIAQTDSYFSSLLHFERSRSDAGLFMTDTNADAIIAQCASFIEGDVKSNFLVTLFNEKIDSLSFLDASRKAELKLENLKAVKTHVLPAYELLMEGLETLKGTGKNENGLCYFPAGKAYYEYLMRDTTGSYLPIEAIEKRIRQQLSQDILACQELLREDPAAISQTAVSSLPSEPEDILADLQEKMKEDFPQPPDVNVDVKYVHKSLEDFLSPAFYLTPPIDDLSENVIYINNGSGYSDLELYTTLAHEGYPGHLYQNICTGSTPDPVRSLFSFGGYTEGWATYVEMESYNYAVTDESVRDCAEFARLNRSVMLGLSSLLDICIHYHGYTREQTGNFLQQLGFARANSWNSLYDAILESPVNYLKYYLGYLSFLDLRDYCQKYWPSLFNLKDFHRQILRIGPCPFPVLEKYMKLYYRSL